MASTMSDLTGKCALITGGASGIGKAIAGGLIDHGAKVMIGSRTADKVEQAAKELSQRIEPADGRDPAEGVVLDVTSNGSVERAVRKAVDAYGRLDILVNSAGIMLRTPTFELTAEQFNEVHETHVTGTLRCCPAAAARSRPRTGAPKR